MKHIGIYEARARLGELVRAAGNGESIVIEVRGQAVALLVPMHAGNDAARAAAQRLEERTLASPAWHLASRELVAEGRRE